MHLDLYHEVALAQSKRKGVADTRSSAFLYGESVFTTLRVEDGRPYFAEAHISRLSSGAEWLWPGTREGAHRLASAALGGCPSGDGVWRLTLARELARGQWRSETAPKLVFDQWWSAGLSTLAPVKLKTVETNLRSLRIPSFVKSGSYLERIVAARTLQEDHEALFHVAGQVLEGLFSNVVFARGNVLVTPADSADVLAGIGLQRLREIAKKWGMEMTSRDVFLSELPQFDSAFLVSAVRGLIPVQSIDDHQYPAHPKEQGIAQEFFRRD